MHRIEHDRVLLVPAYAYEEIILAVVHVYEGAYGMCVCENIQCRRETPNRVVAFSLIG